MEALPTEVANVLLGAAVHNQVAFQVPLARERLLTMLTLEGFRQKVTEAVRPKIACLGKGLGAFCALEPLKVEEVRGV